MMGFSCDEALGDFIDRWDDQVKYLEETLGSKGLARALRSAADDFTTEEDVRKEEFDGMKRPYREGDII